MMSGCTTWFPGNGSLLTQSDDAIEIFGTGAILSPHHACLLPINFGMTSSGVDGAILIKVPGLWAFLAGTGHATLGGQIQLVRNLRVHGKLVSAEISPFTWLLENVAKVTIEPINDCSSIEVDLRKLQSIFAAELATIENDPWLSKDAKVRMREKYAFQSSTW